VLVPSAIRLITHTQSTSITHIHLMWIEIDTELVGLSDIISDISYVVATMMLNQRSRSVND